MSTSLDTRSKDTIVGTIAAGMQGRLATFLNFAIGSVFRAIAEAYAGVCLWLQREIVVVLARTRASTSDGIDLDSFYADYEFVRLGARSATGLVTFGRYSASGSAPVVPIGAVVQTGDGSQRFTVIADPTNGAYATLSGGYVLMAGASTVSVPVVAATAGSVGNVGAGAISLLGSSIPGVDTVTNPAGFTNGADAESDGDFRRRFVLWINSISKGTEAAIGSAITGIEQGLRYQILDNTRPDGTSQVGYVTVYVDDGSGSPSSDLVQLAATAVDAVRSAGVQVAVLGATMLGATVHMTVQIGAGYYGPDVVASVASAISVYVNGLALGQTLRFTRLEQIAYDASPGVVNVMSVSLNSGTGDLTSANGQTIKLTSLVVSQAS